jgi:hypothetical protein
MLELAKEKAIIDSNGAVARKILEAATESIQRCAAE